MVIIDYARPTRVSRRELLDESHAYSTLADDAGTAELAAMARRAGIPMRRVRQIGGGLSCLAVACHEVHQLLQAGARLGTRDEIRALFRRPAGVGHCDTHGDFDALMSPDGCPDCAEADFRAVQAGPSTPGPAMDEGWKRGLRLRRDRSPA